MESGLKRPMGNELCRRLHPNDSRNPFSFTAAPQGVMVWGRGTASAVDRMLSQTAYLRRSFPLVFHSARTLSGSLRSPPSPRGEGFDARKTVFSFRCLPHGGRRYSHFPPLRCIFPLSFIPSEPSPPLRGTFPIGKEGRTVVLLS